MTEHYIHEKLFTESEFVTSYFAVHVDMMGQIHQQVVDLPDGATISDIKIV